MADIKAIAEELVNLTVKEVNELVTVLKEEYGIEPAAAAVAVAGPAAGGAAEAAEEKTSFDISTSIYQAHIASFPLTPCHICYIALYTKMKHADSI